MRIAIIGAGTVGRILGRLANEKGHVIQEVVCRSKRSAAGAVRFIGAGVPYATGQARLSPCDLVMITTPDDRIPEGVAIVGRSDPPARNAVVLHTSGALSSEVLEPARECGYRIGSCHPLQSFESPAGGIELIPETFFCIEGEAGGVSVAQRFVREIGGRHFTIHREVKGLYHSAAVLASGGVTSLVSISIELLSSCGLSETQARRVLMPLVEGTLRNIKLTGPARALTGPVRRGDTGTVGLNLNAIEKISGEWARLYCLLAIRALGLAEQAGADPSDVVEIGRLLRKYEPSRQRSEKIPNRTGEP